MAPQNTYPRSAAVRLNPTIIHKASKKKSFITVEFLTLSSLSTFRLVLMGAVSSSNFFSTNSSSPISSSTYLNISLFNLTPFYSSSKTARSRSYS